MEEESIAAHNSCLFNWRICWCIFLLFSIQYPTRFQSLLTWGDAFLPKEEFSLPRWLGVCKILWADMGALSCAYAKAKGCYSCFGKSIGELPPASAHKCQEGKSRSEFSISCPKIKFKKVLKKMLPGRMFHGSLGKEGCEKENWCLISSALSSELQLFVVWSSWLVFYTRLSKRTSRLHDFQHS